MKKTAFIQLGSNGDLCSLLPCFKHHADAGKTVHVFTRPQYAAVLGGVSYATAVPCPNRFDAEWKAIEQQCLHEYDEVFVPQVSGNDRRTRRAVDNYQCSHWERCGLLDQFHDLPTIFDRRDAQGEAEALKEWMPEPDGRDLLAYNLSGVSSPYAHADEQRAWISDAFGESHRLIDLGAMHLKKIRHLLPFLEQASALITVDTATVHLAHATMTPTVVFWPENVFPRSEPRRNWIYACTHDESIGAARREDIYDIIRLKDYRQNRYCRNIADMTHPYILHAVNYWWREGEDKDGVMQAYRSWEKRRSDYSGFRTVFFEEKNGAGNDATLQDVLDHAAGQTEYGEDVILFASRHRSIPLDATKVKGVTAMQEVCPGIFAFAAGWWKQNRERFAYLACEGCEEVLRMMAMAGNQVLAI